MFDPLNFTKGARVKDVRRWRESELVHGRVAMLAALGFIVGEQLEDFPAFLNADGHITGPAIYQFQQVEARGAVFVSTCCCLCWASLFLASLMSRYLQLYACLHPWLQGLLAQLHMLHLQPCSTTQPHACAGAWGKVHVLFWSKPSALCADILPVLYCPAVGAPGPGHWSVRVLPCCLRLGHTHR